MSGIELAIMAGVMFGCSYTSYKIGTKDGIAKMIDFVMSKKDKRGYTMMFFRGKTIEFVDPMTYNIQVMDSISEAIEKHDRRS